MTPSPQVTNEAVERARKAFRDEAAKWDYACNFAGQTFVFRRLDGAERLTPYECYARRRFSEAYAVPDGHSYVELLERKRDTAALTAALSAMPGQVAADIEAIVLKSMQEEWDEFVADTGDIPADFHFTKRPIRLWFNASTWASNVARAVAKQLGRTSPGEEEWALCGFLREGEGHSVELVCDNPDFNGQPNCKVICCGDWTDWDPREFNGDTMLDALRAAHAAMLSASPTPPTAQEG